MTQLIKPFFIRLYKLIPVLLISFLALAACEGPLGPQGKKGDKGDTLIVPGGTSFKSISVSPPDQTNYSRGARFNSAGLTVYAHYSDGVVLNVNPAYVTFSWEGQPITDYNTAITVTPGTKTVTVTWKGKTCSFDIVVESSGG